MIKIDETKQSIAMTRGDYAALVFTAYDTEEAMYDLDEGDTIQLQICKKYGTPLKTFTKVKADSSATTAEDYTVEIMPEDTKDMKFGNYYYDVSLITAGGYVCTYIGADESNSPGFTILNEAGE